MKSLLEMTQLHPVNYSVKFDGEEGGGPGVNRGWFSVVCSALKDHTKYPDKTFPLFHYPGRLPEQVLVTWLYVKFLNFVYETYQMLRLLIVFLGRVTFYL